MPLYEYECRDHGIFELVRSMKDSADAADCPWCTCQAPRILSAPAVRQVERNTRVALERNERSSHEPSLLRRASSPARDAPPAEAKFRSGTGRPWALEHG
jgi:putative FmdB family regulatory protein